MAQCPKAMLEEELTCPVCLEFFQDPVSLSCQHSFCDACLKTTWSQQPPGLHECPVCRRKSSMEDVKPDLANLKLRNIVHAYLEKEGGAEKGREVGAEHPGVCATHRKKLRFFCAECEELVCVECAETELHWTHTRETVEEAARSCKGKLTALLQALSETAGLKKARTESQYTAHYIKTQAKQTAGQIKSEFAKLHQFLRVQEEIRLAALRQEEKDKTELLTQRIHHLSNEMTSLSERITDIRNRMEGDDLSFLQAYTYVKDRAQSTLKDQEPLSGALIDVARHLGNLTFNVWKNMQEKVQYTPVTLDVNSAHPDLLISGVLLEVRDGGASQPVPDNAERFDSSVSVLGSEGFCSGTHGWVVEVGLKTAWTLGVAKEGVSRKGSVKVCPEEGIWAVGLWEGREYSAGTASLGTPLVLKKKPQRIRVQLDYEGGEVSFYDPSDMSLIYRFVDKFDKERLFPYFSPCLHSDGSNLGALRICPEKVSVTVAPALLTNTNTYDFVV